MKLVLGLAFVVALYVVAAWVTRCSFLFAMAGEYSALGVSAWQVSLIGLLLHELTHVRQVTTACSLRFQPCGASRKRSLPTAVPTTTKVETLPMRPRLAEGQAQMVGNYAHFLVDPTFRVGDQPHRSAKAISGTGILDSKTV